MYLKMLFIILIIITFTSCADGFSFKTIAIYQASESGLKAEITAQGYILNGHDLGNDGFVNGKISSSRFSDTIFFQTNKTKLLALKYKNIETKNNENMLMTLTNCLDTIKNGYYNKQELEELVNVIQLSAAGPKATYMDGQTKLIKVVNVNFETKRGNQKNNE